MMPPSPRAPRAPSASTRMPGTSPPTSTGDTFRGPAIIEEFGSTVPVHPGFTVRVDAFGNLVVTKEA